MNNTKDNLFEDFKAESLNEVYTSKIKGGTHIETNDAHTEGDIGNCDNDSIEFQPASGQVLSFWDWLFS